MNVRRSRSAPPRPQTSSPASLSLRSSTAGWYAEWKARKQAGAAPQSEPETPPPAADEASEALTRWLTGGQ
jgi:hypothetical protein